MCIRDRCYSVCTLFFSKGDTYFRQSQERQDTMDDKTRDNGEGYAPDTQKEPLRGSQSGDKPLVDTDTSESASELPRGDRGDSHDEPEDSSAKESASIKKDSDSHESQLHDGLPDFPSLPDVNQLQGSSNESKRNPSSTYRGATKRFFTKTLDYTTSDSRPMFWKPQVVLLAISAIYVAILCYFSACLLYTSPSPRDRTRSRMPSSA